MRKMNYAAPEIEITIFNAQMPIMNGMGDDYDGDRETMEWNESVTEAENFPYE